MVHAVRSGLEGLAADLQAQRPTLRERAPAYDRIVGELLSLLDDDLAVRDALGAALAARTAVAGYDRPLLLLASLRHDALIEGPAHPLHAAIGAGDSDPAAVSREAVAAALLRPRALDGIARRHVQTNETRRAVAWRWPAHLAGASHRARPLALVDIGASAGLNLVADALPAPWTTPDGAPLEVAEDVDVVLRLGLDARPLDPTHPDDATWLRACIWPGDAPRLARLEAAIEAWRKTPCVVERADVREVPRRIAAALEALPPGGLLIAYQTVVREYLPPEVANAYDTGMRALLASTPPGRLAWVELEAGDPADRVHPAAIIVHLRSGDGATSLQIARCHWHPQTIAVDREAAKRVSDLLRGGRESAR